ncbi:MAG TPA: hypothetical protein VG965_01090 [Patescibacteria group bacterium]|nr:hypothetical protein [Patescibacteria group bacterium]
MIRFFPKTILKKTSGFTYVELALYMGLLAFVLLILVQLFTSVLNVQINSQANSSVQEDGRYILAKLSYDMNHASSITSPLLGSPSGMLKIVINGVTNTYTTSSGKLTINNNFGTNNLNSIDTTVSNLSFKRLGNVGGKNTITVNFSLTSNIKKVGGNDSENFETTLGTR